MTWKGRSGQWSAIDKAQPWPIRSGETNVSAASRPQPHIQCQWRHARLLASRRLVDAATEDLDGCAAGAHTWRAMHPPVKRPNSVAEARQAAVGTAAPLTSRALRKPAE